MSDRTSSGERCPICGKASVESARPFCSNRCADVDLQRWFTGAYAIPVPDEDDVSEKAAPDEDGAPTPGRASRDEG